MKNDSKFYFSGLGCIEAFEKGKTDADMKLKILECADDVVLRCTVKSKKLIKAIVQLLTGTKAISHGILVEFQIEYKGFDYWHPGRFDGDSLNVLQFHGLLTHGKIWLVNGENPSVALSPVFSSADDKPSSACNLSQKGV